MNKLIVLTILVLIPSFGVCASKDKSVDEMPVKASPVGKDKTTVVDSQDINPTTNKPRSKAVELEDLPISIATQAALDLKVNTSAFAINNLTDVDTTGKATGKILKFDASGNLVVGDDLTGAVGGLPTIIASGAYTVDTASISANTCASTVAVTASGVATTDIIIATPSAILSSVAGFGVTTAGAVRVDIYPTSGNVNFQFCNPTGATIDPGSVTFNWKVIR